MRMAFKEWAVIVDALGHGEQILILRKGGIAEGREGFHVEHSRFFLFPTLFHQQRESVIESARMRFDQIAPSFPPPEIVRLEFFAEVTAWRRLESLSATELLHGQHVWQNEVIAQRFGWRQTKNIFAMALRAHRLPLPIELPVAPAYGGCKSWLELDREIPVTGAVPVLDQPAFDHKLQQFFAALNTSLTEPT